MRTHSLISTVLLFLSLAVNIPALASPNMAEFSRCLKDSGMTLYSAHWCSYCFMQLTKFDPGLTTSAMRDEHRIAKQFPFVTECASHAATTGIFDNPECKDLYAIPAWKLPNGNIRYGVHTLQELADISNCKLP